MAIFLRLDCAVIAWHCGRHHTYPPSRGEMRAGCFPATPVVFLRRWFSSFQRVFCLSQLFNKISRFHEGRNDFGDRRSSARATTSRLRSQKPLSNPTHRHLCRAHSPGRRGFHPTYPCSASPVEGKRDFSTLHCQPRSRLEDSWSSNFCSTSPGRCTMFSATCGAGTSTICSVALCATPKHRERGCQAPSRIESTPSSQRTSAQSAPHHGRLQNLRHGHNWHLLRHVSLKRIQQYLHAACIERLWHMVVSLYINNLFGLHVFFNFSDAPLVTCGTRTSSISSATCTWTHITCCCGVLIAPAAG